jgi:hypothetical protein
MTISTFAHVATGACIAASLYFFAPHAHAAPRPDEPLVAALADAPADLAKQTPTFGCYDPTNKRTCQELRREWGNGGVYNTRDYADGWHVLCYRPDGVDNYQVCVGDFNLWSEILVNDRWEFAPLDDQRCTVWGGPYSASYLACVAALPHNIASK